MRYLKTYESYEKDKSRLIHDLQQYACNAIKHEIKKIAGDKYSELAPWENSIYVSTSKDDYIIRMKLNSSEEFEEIGTKIADLVYDKLEYFFEVSVDNNDYFEIADFTFIPKIDKKEFQDWLLENAPECKETLQEYQETMNAEDLGLFYKEAVDHKKILKEYTHEELNDLLYDSAGKGYLYNVKRCVENGADIDCLRWEKWTPLFLAAREGKLDVVKYLVEHGANIDHQNQYGYTPLIISSYCIYRDYQDGKMINKKYNNENYETVKYLISQGADVNKKTVTHQPRRIYRNFIEISLSIGINFYKRSKIQRELIKLNSQIYLLLKEANVLHPNIKEEFKDLEDAQDLGLLYQESTELMIMRGYIDSRECIVGNVYPIHRLSKYLLCIGKHDYTMFIDLKEMDMSSMSIAQIENDSIDIEKYLMENPNKINPLLNCLKSINFKGHRYQDIGKNISFLINRLESNPEIKSSLDANDLGLFYKETFKYIKKYEAFKNI